RGEGSEGVRTPPPVGCRVGSGPGGTICVRPAHRTRHRGRRRQRYPRGRTRSRRQSTVGSEGSTLKDRVAAEMKDALKQGQKVRLSTLRLLSASAKNREVELRRPLSDEEFLEVVGREVKRRTEAIEAYQSAGRDDLVAK